MTPAAKARRTLLNVEIPRDELALRIAIPCLGVCPKPDLSATEALDQLAAVEPQMIDGFRRAADAAVMYFHERVNAARQPS